MVKEIIDHVDQLLLKSRSRGIKKKKKSVHTSILKLMLVVSCYQQINHYNNNSSY